MPKGNPLVTVICTCFNHNTLVTKALDSVLHQNYKNIELLIVDDHSEDDSVKTIKEWISKNNFGTLIINKENLGLTKSYNNTFKKTNGEYLIDLSADDALLPHCIEVQLSVFNAYHKEHVGIVYGNAMVINKSTNTSYVFFDTFSQAKKTLTPQDGYIYKELIDHSNTICSVSAMTKRSVFESLNGYDEQLIYEDYDLWLRVARKYYILYVDDIIVNRVKLINSLGNLNYLGFNKKNYKFKHSTYLVVKKTFKMNRTKAENKASFRKILMEIKANFKILNFPLLIKYFVLLIRFNFKT